MLIPPVFELLLTVLCLFHTKSEQTCPVDEHEIATAIDTPDQSCSVFKYMSRYCCKTAEPPLKNCHWVGQGDCADNTCTALEVTLRTDQLGDNRFGCLWSRKKALCCTPNDDVFDTPTCDKPLCQYEGSGFSCDPDPYADDFSDEDYCEPGFCDESFASSLLERRGRPPFTVDWQIIVSNIVRSFSLHLQMRGYPGSGRLHRPTRSTPASNSAFRLVQNDCRSTEIEVIDRTTLTTTDISSGYDTEHNPDAQYVRDFVRTLVTGILPNGSETTAGAVDSQFLENNWNEDVLPSNFPRAGSSRSLLTPNGYFFDRLGSQGNRFPMLLCQRTLNQMKGRIFNLRMSSDNGDDGDDSDSDDDGSDSDDDDSESEEDQNSSVGRRPNPMGIRRFQRLLRQTAQGNVGAQNQIFESIRMAIGVFRYINHPDARPTVQRNRRELRNAITLIAQVPRLQPLSNAVAIQREFDNSWYREAADRTRTWVAARILDIRLRFGELERNNQLPPNSVDVQDIVDALADQIHYIQPPPDI